MTDPKTAEQTRRDFLKLAGAAAGGAFAASCATGNASSSAAAAASARKPVLTIAHLTDIHVKPEGKGPRGMRNCLRHVHARADKPDLILQGGDSIMDVLGATEERAQVQFDLWKKILAEENSIPIRHCIGNHDCWGWQKEKAKTTGNEPKYGKKWICEVYEIDRGYYSFDQAGWHFIVLDSVQERGGGAYKPVLDEEQFAWLSSDLDAVPKETPVLILSHVPIISVGPFFFPDKDNIVVDYQFKLIGALMHQDTWRIKELIDKHPNVKLCLSGHVHLRDRVDYNNVTYLCNGSVCGSWWYGKFHETNPGYGIVRLFGDGTFENEYVEYPWEQA